VYYSEANHDSSIDTGVDYTHEALGSCYGNIPKTRTLVVIFHIYYDTNSFFLAVTRSRLQSVDRIRFCRQELRDSRRIRLRWGIAIEDLKASRSQ